MSSDRAVLALEDGTTFEGTAFGARTTVAGEVCFNTGMTGYQEVLTDPSYHGQIVTMTAPQIGNTGVNVHDDQSIHPWVAGFVVRDLSATYSSWRADDSLDNYLARHNVPGLADVDTRRLTRHIRTRGAMRGVLSSVLSPEEAVDAARGAPQMIGLDLAHEVTTAEPYEWDADRAASRDDGGYAAGAEGNPTTSQLIESFDGTRRRVVAYDFGMKQNILDLLVATGHDVTVVPASTPAAWVLERDFEGVFLSNGPGDPEPVVYGVEAVQGLLGKLPIFGICLGHQVLALALGAETYKLPFGHRGSNHPVKRTDHPRVEITCQNHGFAVAADSLEGAGAHLTHVNLNDSTVEGLSVPGVAFSVQYHPESGPGPHDSRYLFDAFHTAIERFEPSELSRAGQGGTHG